MSAILPLLGVSALALVPLYVFRRPSARDRPPPRMGAPTDATRSCISWRAATLGSLSYLEQHTSSVAPLAPEECLVEVRAIGLNYADVFCVLGLYEAANKMLAQSPPDDRALVPGLEFAGNVIEVGDRVTDLAVGDRVYGFCRFGAYRTKVVSRPALLRKMPDAWSYVEGAALLVQGLTAWHGLVELGGAKQGSRVLVHSAAGGVGCAAMQICASIGAAATGVVGSPAKLPFLTERFPQCTPLVRAPERQRLPSCAALTLTST